MSVIRTVSRELRKNQTSSEKLFWNIVRNRRFFNYKFYRQYPIKYKYNGKYRFLVADFCCKEKKLIIEIDGKIHDQQRDRDKLRDVISKHIGYKVIRIKNIDLQYDRSLVVKKLKEYLD